MKAKNWISSAVIYQVNLRGLAAREPRNAVEAMVEKPITQSPLAYLTASLPRLQRVGFNVLYLMPPYPIGRAMRKGIGSPYASRDFRAVEPEYGTLEELASLVRRAHERKLKVIFDITPNHTSRDHVWMAGHPEYYVKSAEGGAFFDCDWSDTAKLDYTQPALRAEMLSVYDFWLSFLGTNDHGAPDGIDGFRLDMAHFINDKSFWDEALPELCRRHATRQLLFMAECYGFQNNLDLFRRGMTAAYDDDFYKLCQYHYAVDPEGNSVLHPAGDAAHNQDYRDKYEAFLTDGIAGAAERLLLNYEQELRGFPEPHFVSRYTDNHDEGRGLYRFGAGAVKAMNRLAFLTPHSLPFLLTGEEFGALNRPPIHDRLKPCDKGRRIVQGERVFNQEGVEFEGNLFDRGFEKRTGWLAFFKELVQLRKKVPELSRGQLTLLDVGEECARPERSVVAFDCAMGRRLVRCAINLGPQPRKLARAAHLFQGTPLYGALRDGTLEPFEAVVVRLA